MEWNEQALSVWPSALPPYLQAIAEDAKSCACTAIKHSRISILASERCSLMVYKVAANRALGNPYRIILAKQGMPPCPDCVMLIP